MNLTRWKGNCALGGAVHVAGRWPTFFYYHPSYACKTHSKFLFYFCATLSPGTCHSPSSKHPLLSLWSAFFPAHSLTHPWASLSWCLSLSLPYALSCITLECLSRPLAHFRGPSSPGASLSPSALSCITLEYFSRPLSHFRGPAPVSLLQPLAFTFARLTSSWSLLSSHYPHITPLKMPIPLSLTYPRP